MSREDITHWSSSEVPYMDIDWQHYIMNVKQSVNIVRRLLLTKDITFGQSILSKQNGNTIGRWDPVR